jgi:ribose transport system substrate-binding protein
VGGQERLVNEVMEAVKAKGWQMVVTTSGGNPQKQNDDIDYLISLGADAIIANPDDSSAICTASEKAKEAGVPFFTADRSPSGCAISMTVLSDNHVWPAHSRRSDGRSLQKKNGEPKGKVLEITGNLGQNVSQLRRDSFRDVWTNIQPLSHPEEWRTGMLPSAADHARRSERQPGPGRHLHAFRSRLWTRHGSGLRS